MIQTSTANAHNVTYESIFQADVISQMQAHGWQLGHASAYHRASEQRDYRYKITSYK